MKLRRRFHRVLLCSASLAGFFLGVREGSVLSAVGGLSSGHSEPASQAKASSQPFDPFRAQKDIEVGRFYMKKGDLDAAIDRFQDAIRHKPRFARPRLLLGEAYEKKGEKAEALKYFKEYLEILPKAPDAPKVRRRIEKLSQELGRKPTSDPPPSAESRKESHRPVVVGVTLLFGAELRRV